MPSETFISQTVVSSKLSNKILILTVHFFEIRIQLFVDDAARWNFIKNLT